MHDGDDGTDGADGCILGAHVCRITRDGHGCGSGSSIEMIQILKKMLFLVEQFCPGLWKFLRKRKWIAC